LRKRNVQAGTIVFRRGRSAVLFVPRSPHSRTESLMAIGKHVFGWILGVPAALLTLIYVLAHI